MDSTLFALMQNSYIFGEYRAANFHGRSEVQAHNVRKLFGFSAPMLCPILSCVPAVLLNVYFTHLSQDFVRVLLYLLIWQSNV